MVVSVVSSFLVANAGVAKTYYDSLEKNRVENGHMAFNVRPEDEFLEKVAEKAKIELYPADYYEEENGGMTLRVYRLGSNVNLPEVTQGRLPEAGDEIALDNLHSEIVGIKIGDRIPVDGHTVTVTGLIAIPNYTALFKDNADLMFDSEKFGVAVMSAEAFDEFHSDHMTIGYAWRYESEPKTDKEKSDAAEEVLSALRDELVATNTEIVKRALMGEEGLTMLEVTDFLPDYENKSINFASEDMNGDQAAMTAFLYIVVAVLSFIVVVTTLNTLSKEAGVIGTLRASGYTRGEMVRHYMVLPFLAFFFGMVVGNILGYTCMRDFMLNIYRTMYSFGTTTTFWNREAFLKTTLIPSVIMILINLIILTWKMRISPLSFLRREVSGRKRKRALRLSKKLPFTWRFRIRIILQNLSNYITMAVGIVLAGSIIVFGLMFKPLLETVAKRITDTTLSHYQVILKTPEEATEESAERFAIATLETTRGDFKTDEISVYGIAQESRYVKTSIPEGKVLLSNGFMEKYSVNVGDQVALYDKYADKTYEFTVAGDYPYEASLALFMNLDEFNETFEKTPDYYSGYFAEEELSSLKKSNIYMTLDSAAFGGFADQLWKSFADFMGPVRWFGVIMFVLMVYLLSKQIIERNQTSISMTKILGFTGGEIGGLYIVSTSLVVIASLLLAVPLVDQMIRLIFKYYLYQRMSGYLPYCISSDCYVQMILLGLGSYVVVVILQLFKIRRIPKSDALKTLE